MTFRRGHILFLVLLLFSQHVVHAQEADISNLKWWIGFKTGLTFSQPKIMERYSVLDNPSQPKDEAEEKKYDKTLANMGQTLGAMFGYAITQHVLVVFQPAYSNYKYSYDTRHDWTNSSGYGYTISTEQNHRLGYIELPITLLLRIKTGRVEPYVNLGWYYGFFVGGRKRLKYAETYSEGGIGHDEPTKTEVIGMGSFLMKSQMGFTSGVGVSYLIQYFRIGLELAYRQGQYNITDTKNRYSDKHLMSKFYEVPDDLRLNHLELTLNIFMPVDNLIHLHKGSRGKSGKKKAWNSTKD